jgi:hypothetical protein
MTKPVQRATDFYLSSRDFNGIPLADIYKYMGLPEEQFKEQIIQAINKRQLDLVYEGDIPNPHIKPFPAPRIVKQIEKLESLQIDDLLRAAEAESETFGEGQFQISFGVDNIGCCVYPTPEHLRNVVNWRKYSSRPFTLRLAMGEWQLRPYFFEQGILAIYRNDPRYRYHTDDITGSLSAVSEELLQPSDQIYIKHFGFGFDEMGNRSVAVLLTDLSGLSPQHQQIWKAKMLARYYRYKLHPDFRKSILGHFYDGSVFSALTAELKLINEMSTMIQGVPLFKKTFEDDEKPDNFGFLLLPTRRELEMFYLTLDRMLFDNIDHLFFRGTINANDLRAGEDLTKIAAFRKLEIWLNKNINFTDPQPKDEMLKTIREIRRLRSKPAHTYVENKWDVKLFDEQKKLMEKAYRSARTLRLIFANHPLCRAVEVPDWLLKGQIRTF